VAFDRPAALRQAEKLLRLGRLDQAIAEYGRILEDQPQDWTTVNALGDVCVRAGYVEQGVAHFTRVADHLCREGFRPKAGALYRKILKLQPANEHALLQSAEIAVSAGLLADARTHFQALGRINRERGDQAGAARIVVRMAALDPDDDAARRAGARARVELGDPAAAVRELKELTAYLLDNGHVARAIEALKDAVAIDPADTGAQTELSVLLAPANRDEGFERLSVAVDTLAQGRDWSGASATLERWLQVMPQHVAALTRLVEIAVDAGMEDAIDAAQERLADAHLLAGDANAARHIAEDLARRRPDDPEHRKRLRTSLERLGVTDPDAVLAATLEAPAFDAVTDPVPFDAAPRDAPATEAVPADIAPALQDRTVIGPRTPSPEVRQRSKVAEIDLTVVLEEIRKPRAEATVAPPVPAPADLDAVFAQMRAVAGTRSAEAAAEQDFARGMVLLESGDDESAVPFLQKAVRTPRFRFEAASALGRAARSSGQIQQSIDWMERAAEAPPTSADAGRALLYELAEQLESVGETTRALTIYLELHADANDYRDVALRVNRLVKMQAN
jgi:tetratricopeptide (TPR) repeat protein